MRVERVTVYCRTRALWRLVSGAHLPACTEHFISLAELAYMGVRQGSRPVVDGPCTREGQEQRRARQWSVSKWASWKMVFITRVSAVVTVHYRVMEMISRYYR